MNKEQLDSLKQAAIEANKELSKDTTDKVINELLSHDINDMVAMTLKQQQIYNKEQLKELNNNNIFVPTSQKDYFKGHDYHRIALLEQRYQDDTLVDALQQIIDRIKEHICEGIE